MGVEGALAGLCGEGARGDEQRPRGPRVSPWPQPRVPIQHLKGDCRDQEAIFSLIYC